MNALPARRSLARAAQLLAVAIALAAIWALILSAAALAATRHVGEGQLSAARDAVDAVRRPWHRVVRGPRRRPSRRHR